MPSYWTEPDGTEITVLTGSELSEVINTVLCEEALRQNPGGGHYRKELGAESLKAKFIPPNELPIHLYKKNPTPVHAIPEDDFGYLPIVGTYF